MITFPFWFKILLGWFGLLIIIGIIRLLSKNKYIDSIRKLPDEKREKLKEIHSIILLILKMLLWALPLNLILMPYLVYTYCPEKFLHIFVMMVIVYMIVIGEFLFTRSTLIKLNMSNKSKHNQSLETDA